MGRSRRDRDRASKKARCVGAGGLTKSKADVKELQRRLVLLERLEGPRLWLKDGLHVVRIERVVDPRALALASMRGRVSLAELSRAVEFEAPPVAVNARVLSRAQRDLKTIELAPELRALARDAKRIFKRYGELDDAWIAARRATLEALSQPYSPEADTPFARVLELVAIVHGAASASTLAAMTAMSIAQGGRARREAQATLDAIVAGLSGRGPVSGVAQKIADTGARPGRSQVRWIVAILAEALGVSPIHPLPPVAGTTLAERTLELGMLLVAKLPSTRTAEFRTRLEETLAIYGLRFDPGERPRAFSRAQLDAARKYNLHRFSDLEVELSVALQLQEIGVDDEYQFGRIAKLAAAGAPVELLKKAIALGYLEQLVALEAEPETAAEYCRWILRLAPEYERIGLKLKIPAKLFSSLPVKGREHFAMLAVCLMHHADRASKGEIESAVATLDATLGLFREIPDEAAALSAKLSAITPGEGSKRMPELAEWLKDDVLLDRWCHLSGLAGEDPALSKRLRRDFERAAREAREREHLEKLAEPSEAQRKRLALLAGRSEKADPAWTRRRIEDRVRELYAAAYRLELDRALRRVVARAWGFQLGPLTPSWRDAIRFFLGVSRNRELLGTVLRHASSKPGTAVAPSLPACAKWIERARKKFGVEAWLAPRRREVSITGHGRCVLAFEDDAIEILRMGIPFQTCLSLESGSNAASTVINAADANKRVIYLRDAHGAILARKLLAVSSEWKLIGYRLYDAVKEAHEEIERAFSEFIAELAAETRLELARAGAPEQLHEGFWYDDGIVPFPGTSQEELSTSAALADYCAHLGVGVPRPCPQKLCAEAEVWAARETGDVARALAASHHLGWGHPGWDVEWMVDAIDARSLDRAVDESRPLAEAAAVRAEKRGYRALAGLAARSSAYTLAELVAYRLERFEPTRELVDAFIDAALEHARRFAWDDHGLEHQVLNRLDALAERLPVRDLFAVIEPATKIFAWIRKVGPGCTSCVVACEERLVENAAHRAYRRDPDPTAVLRVLSAKKPHPLAQRIALELAAEFELANPPKHVLATLDKLARARPDLARSAVLFAARVRHADGKLDGIPLPDEPPFEALGSLHLEVAGLEELLEPWSMPRVRVETWQPGPWEAHHHRKFETPWRKKLIALARSEDPAAEVAREWLTKLGVEEAVVEFAQRKKLDRARGVRKIIHSAVAGDPPSMPGREVEIDPCVVAHALQFLRTYYAGPPDASLLDGVEAAFHIVSEAEALPELLLAAFRLPDAMKPAALIAIEGAAFALFLDRRVPLWCTTLDPELAARAWQREDLRPALARTLGQRGYERLLWKISEIAAAAARSSLSIGGLLEDTARAMVDADRSGEFPWSDRPEDAHAVIRAALEGRNWPKLVELYRELPSESLAAFFLAELDRTGAVRDPALAETLAQGREFPEWIRHRRGWLEARIFSSRA